MAEKIHVRTNINNTEVDFLCENRQSLLECLRDVVGLTGAKEGCNDGNCGACTVILDGRIVDSCCVLGVEAQGMTITTIEGVATPEGLHPLQQGVPRRGRPPVRHLHSRLHRGGQESPWKGSRTLTKPASVTGWPATSAAAPATIRSSGPS